MKCWQVSRIVTWPISPEGAKANNTKLLALIVWISWLHVNHQPAEQMCADSRLQTDVSRCVTQHLSHHSTAIPTSRFTHSRARRAGMRHKVAFDPNVFLTWRVSDGAGS